MAIHHVTVTLGTGATPIVAQSGTTPTINCRLLRIENDTGNADVKVGGSSITSTDYGMIVTAGPTNAVLLAPSDGNVPINLASTYLLGTSTQKVHCLYIQ